MNADNPQNTGPGENTQQAGGQEPQSAQPVPGPADRIRLVGLGGIGHHGVLAEERRDGQTFRADLTLELDARAAAAGDDLTRTVNYAELSRAVVEVIEGEPVNLIETLATRIAAAALEFEAVQTVTVTVHKPDAPVGVPFTDVEITIVRTRADDLRTVSAAGAVDQVPAPADVPAVAAAAPVVLPEEAPAEHLAQDEPAEPAGPDLHEAPQDPTPVVIALGGNIGDVRGTLRAVVADLRTTNGLTVQDVSPLARTAPVLADGAAEQPDFLNAVVLGTTTLSPMDLLATLQDLEEAYGRRRTVRWGERTLDLDIILYGSLTSQEEDLTLPHPRASERAFVLVPWAQADPDAFLPGLGGGPVATLAETAPDRSGVRWLALDWLDERARASAEPSKPAAASPAPAQPGPAQQPAAEDRVAEDDQARERAAEGQAGDRSAGGQAGTGAAAAAAPSAAARPAAAGIGRASFPPPAEPAEPAEPPVQSAPQEQAPGEQEPQEELQERVSAESASPQAAPAEPQEPAAEDSPTAEERSAPEGSPVAEEPSAVEESPAETPEPETSAGAPDPAPQESATVEVPGDQDPQTTGESDTSARQDGPSQGEADEPNLPWAPSSTPAPSPITPKWQPLRRNNDT